MSLTGIAKTLVTPPTGTSTATATAATAPPHSPASESAAIGGGAAGAYGVQPAGTGSLVKKMLAGGVVGAGLGFGASFIPGISFVPHFKLVLPAAGAAIGAIGGLAAHVMGNRRANLAMQAQQAPDGQVPVAVQAPAMGGPTLKMGARGKQVRTLQVYLQKLGVYGGKVNSRYDAPTAAAVRKYEALKGVAPTGVSSPELRAAVAQDARLLQQYS